MPNEFTVQKLLTQFTAIVPVNVSGTGPIHMHIFFAIILLNPLWLSSEVIKVDKIHTENYGYICFKSW